MNEEANVHNDLSSGSETSVSNAMRGLLRAQVATDTISDAGRKASAVVKQLGDSACEVGARTGARVARQVEAQPVPLSPGRGIDRFNHRCVAGPPLNHQVRRWLDDCP